MKNGSIQGRKQMTVRSYKVTRKFASDFSGQRRTLVMSPGLHVGLCGRHTKHEVCNRRLTYWIDSISRPRQCGTNIRDAERGELPRYTVAIFDMYGRLLVHERVSGSGQFTWDGRDTGGRTVPDGIYLYRIETGSESLNGKIIRR